MLVLLLLLCAFLLIVSIYSFILYASCLCLFRSISVHCQSVSLSLSLSRVVFSLFTLSCHLHSDSCRWTPQRPIGMSRTCRHNVCFVHDGHFFPWSSSTGRPGGS